MGHKILTLFDIEFKRVQKLFFTIISLLVLGNIVVFYFSIYNVINSVNVKTGLKQGLEVLKTDLGRNTFLEQLHGITYSISNMLMVLALLWCAYYSILIWKRDFSGKSKSIYTLFMLPESRFIIFISKLTTILTLIYSVIFVQHLLWSIEAFIISKYTDIPIINMMYIINNTGRYSGFELSVPIYPMEFIVIFIIGPIVCVTAIFASVLISKSIKKAGGFVGLLYIVSLATVYLSVTIGVYEYSDNILRNNIIFYILAFVSSIYISYISLKDRIYD